MIDKFLLLVFLSVLHIWGDTFAWPLLSMCPWWSVMRFFSPDVKILQDYVPFLIRGYSYHLSWWIPMAIGLVSWVSKSKIIPRDTLSPALIFLTLGICVHPTENTLGSTNFLLQTPQGAVQLRWVQLFFDQVILAALTKQGSTENHQTINSFTPL